MNNGGKWAESDVESMKYGKEWYKKRKKNVLLGGSLELC